MYFFHRVAGAIADAVGRESLPVRAIHPWYERLLEARYGRAGMPWAVNDTPLRVSIRDRSRFPRHYEPEVAAFLRERVRPGAVCFDVGAHIGLHAVQLADWAGPKGKVFAFEPNPEVRAVLSRVVRLNGLSGRVEVVATAVAAEASAAARFRVCGFDMMSHLELSARPVVEPTIDVPVVTLDGYAASRKVEPDLLLVDVEGFEIGALAGARGLFERKGDRLEAIVEMHPAAWEPAGTTREEAERLFSELGRVPVPLTGQRDPFRDYGLVHLAPAKHAPRKLFSCPNSIPVLPLQRPRDHPAPPPRSERGVGAQPVFDRP